MIWMKKNKLDPKKSNINFILNQYIRGHIEDILDISWSKDSQTIVSGSIDNSVMVWNVASGTNSYI